MRKVTIFDTELCLNCWSVQSLLEKRDIPYEHVIVVEDSEEHDALRERTGMADLPWCTWATSCWAAMRRPWSPIRPACSTICDGLRALHFVK